MSRAPRWRGALTGYLFILPAFVGYLLFTLGPALYAVGLSFTEYEILSSPEFVGLRNYERLLDDARLREVYVNTVVYVVAAVVFINAIGLALAVLLNTGLPAVLRNVLRAAYFFPSLVGLVYVAIIWQFLLQKDVGVVNYYLTQIGLPRIDWLGSPNGAVGSVILVDTWRNVGFAMLVYLAALQDVPRDVVEAARVDGANEAQVFRRVILPSISPAMFFNVSLTVIGAFQIFESVVVLTRGGPGDDSRSVVMYLWEKGFQSFDMGYASAVAMSLFTIVMILTLVQFGLRRMWVYYE